MRTLILASLLLCACTEAGGSRITSVAPADVELVADAERAFATEATTRGWVEAYETWADNDAVVIQANIANARDFARNVHPDVRGDTSLNWSPEFAGISSGGDFGFTAGPFNGDDSAFGHYLTVWRKIPSGEWRWLYEGGVDVSQPLSLSPLANVTAATAPEAAEGPDAAAGVAAAESALAAAAATDAPAALIARLAPSARVQRESQPAATSAAAIETLLKAGPPLVSYTNLRTTTAPAGDMAFTVGEVKWPEGQGFYQRIWVRTQDDWRIVMDQFVWR